MPEVVHLLEGAGRGPLWGTASDDLNATLLAWPAGDETPAHVNAERDVLLVVVGGDGTVEVAGESLRVTAGDALLVEKGVPRRIRPGTEGIRYLAVHRRRGGLQLGRAPA